MGQAREVMDKLTSTAVEMHDVDKAVELYSDNAVVMTPDAGPVKGREKISQYWHQFIDGFPGQEHALPITPLYKDVIALFAQTGIAYTPTLLVVYGGPWAENYWYEHENVYNDSKLQRFTPYEELAANARRRVRSTHHLEENPLHLPPPTLRLWRRRAGPPRLAWARSGAAGVPWQAAAAP